MDNYHAFILTGDICAPQLQENKIYTFTHLTAKCTILEWNKKTDHHNISQTPDTELENLKLQDNVNPQQENILTVPNTDSIESVEKFN